MQESKKIRQNLERKIRIQEQKQGHGSPCISSPQDMTNDLLKKFGDLDVSLEENSSLLLDNSLNYQKQPQSKFSNNHQFSSNKFQLEQKWKEIEQEQLKIANIQKQIDTYRRQILCIANDEHALKSKYEQQKLKQEKILEEMNTQNKVTLEKIKVQQEQKIEDMLKKIDHLIQQKREFNNECEKYRSEEKKMEKLLKDQTERYKAQIRNAKEAFTAIQKDRRGRWEKERIAYLKEQAVTETQPRILEIIKQSNLSIRNAETQCAQQADKYRQQMKQKYEKEFLQVQERLFTEQQQAKQRLRLEQSSKANKRYQEMECQFAQDREKMREEYNRQVAELDLKVRNEIQHFLDKNKQSHEDNLQQIRRLRQGYEQNIREMKNGINQRLEAGLVQLEQKHLQRYHQALAQLETENQRKYLKAQQKIKYQINKRIQNVTLQLDTMKAEYRHHIHQDYDSKTHQEQQRLSDEKQRLIKIHQSLEEKLIGEERKLEKERQRLRQVAADMERVESSNYLMGKRLIEQEAELQALQYSEESLEAQVKQRCRRMQAELKQQYQSIRSDILTLQSEKQKKEKQMIDLYVVEQKRLDEQMKSYKEEIEVNLDKRVREIARVREELKDVEIGNEQKTRILEEERKKMQ